MIQLPNQEIEKPWVHHKAYTYMSDKSIIVAYQKIIGKGYKDGTTTGNV